MAKMHILVIALVSMALVGMQAHAALPSYGPSFYSFLDQFIPPATVNGASYFNQSIGGSSYVIVETSKNSFVVVNTTGGKYSFVLDNSTAYAVMRPFALVYYYPSNSSLSELNSYMRAYEITSTSTLSDCLIETGLTRGQTCTEANSCQSCQTVPNCRKFLAAAGGATSLAGTAIANFSIFYGSLNASYNSYFSILANLTPNNTYQSLQLLSLNIKRISNISTLLPRNPLFPVPQGFSPGNFSTCTHYVTGQAPWYCNSFGYCKSLNFNTTDLYGAQITVNNLLSSPISNSSIKALAVNTTFQAFSFLRPELQQGLSAIIAANYGRYNATVANASVLLAVYRNESLSSALSALQSTFGSLVSYNFRLNASTYNSLIAAEFANVSLTYIPLNAQYSTLKAIATNNTALVLQRELEFQSEPASLAQLAYTQQSINDLLASGINSSQYGSVYAQLKSTQAGLSAVIAPVSMPALIKSIDGGFVSSMLSGSNAPVPSKLAAAPLYVFLLTLLVSIAIVVAIYFLTYHRLRKKSRLHLHRTAKRAWMLLFIVLFIVAIAFSYLTSTYAAQANSFLPIDGFAAQLGSHSSVVIAYNSTAAAANQSIQQCAAAVAASLNGTGKSVSIITISNYTCVGSSNPFCFDQLLASNKPIIILGRSPVSSVAYRGMYGQTLYANGEAASGGECYLNGILKVR